MRDSYTEFLRVNRSALTGAIMFKADKFIVDLESDKVITPIQREQILRGDAISHEQVGRLLDFMAKRTDAQFEQFCRILKKSEGQSNAQEILEKLDSDDYQRIFPLSDTVDAGAMGGPSSASGPGSTPAGHAGTSLSVGQKPNLRRLTSSENDAAEYNRIRDRVMNYIKPQHNWNPTITSIEKVMNPVLQDKWERAKGDMFDSTMHDMLFHGTDSNSAALIVQDGFKLSEKEGSWFGKGVYFATDSSKSAQSRYTRGSNMLLLCDVLLGKSKTVHTKMPDMTHDKLTEDGFDSLYAKRDTADTRGVLNDEYVVFKPERALPKYVVLYKVQ